jgi:hypothetical protein
MRYQRSLQSRPVADYSPSNRRNFTESDDVASTTQDTPVLALGKAPAIDGNPLAGKRVLIKGRVEKKFHFSSPIAFSGYPRGVRFKVSNG